MAGDESKKATGLAEAAPHYHGHPQRLRQRFLEAGSEAFSDYELLELVLFRAIPQRDLKPLAKSLIATFGSFAEVIAAPPQRLTEIKGLGDAAIVELKIVQGAANRLARGQVKKRPLLSSWSNVLDYCRTAMAFADKEQFRILFLDKRNQLIADEVQQTGTIDALARRHPDDAIHHRRRKAAWDFRARPHHRRQGRPRELERAEADLATSAW